MKFQFQIDGRRIGPIRDRWVDAAQDAVNAGYASWGKRHKTVYLDDSQGATIEKVNEL